MPSLTVSPKRLLAHNLDAALALIALPVFAVAGLPLTGWFWATLLWAVNRSTQVMLERRAARSGALTGVGIMGASMLVRPWVGMLLLFLITRHDTTLLVSSFVLFLILLTVDIVTRVLTHRNVGMPTGGAI